MSNLELPFAADPEESSPDEDQAARQAAVDPTRNVALAASAGTGKTSVLVDRFVNLLKAGVDPTHILAITFTRKAAAEMRQRILATLRTAAQRGEIPPARWRDLRDRPGDIAISTIDAFCLSLLREFPLEADLDPGFDVADETEIPRLVEESLDRTLRTCRALTRDDEDMALLFVALTERRLRQAMANLLDRRLVAEDILRRSLSHGPRTLTGQDAARRVVDRLRDQFLSVPGGLKGFLDDGPVAQPAFVLLATELRLLCGLSSEGESAARLAEPARVRALVEDIRAHFFTQDNKPRQKSRYPAADHPSPAAAKRHKEVVTFLAPVIGAAMEAFRRDLNVVISRGAWRVFHIALADYQRTLAARGVLDFAGLLSRALDLLKRMDEFARSRYLLESRFHHVLVDEFQDTSRAQWELVSLLVRAWTEGAGVADAAPLKPSIFIVGDMKQSIYGFRDADVAIFNRATGFIDRLRPGTRSRRSIARNFRSVPEILSFVNDLFGAIDSLDDRDDAFTFGDADRFPIAPAPRVAEPALGLAVANDLEVCADLVADEIGRLLRERATVRDRTSGVRREVTAADIAVLFRSRESHREFEAALDRRGIPAYVYKGLGFFDADEVKDVLALLRWLAHPTSNLRAAAFMRSRVIRLSDLAIHVLSPDLAAALVSDDSPAALADLDDEDRRVLLRARESARGWLALVDRVPPIDLVERVLDESAYAYEITGPRVAQARENLKKVRGLVRRIQNRGYATVARIADHLDRLSAGDESNAVVDALDAVNLLTIHGSKGLEFPIVFLVNLGKGINARRLPIRVAEAPSRSSPSGEEREVDGLPEPSVSVGDFQSEADDDAPVKAREETKRLLYVAMTRARDRLYLSAVLKEGRLPAVRGSLAEVLPVPVRTLLENAVSARGTVQWETGGRQHLFQVCEPDEPRNMGGPGANLASPSAATSDDFAPVMDDRSFVRDSVLGYVGARVAPGDAWNAASSDGGSPERALIGSLVHRLLQLAAPGPPPARADVTKRIATLIRAEELVWIPALEPFKESVLDLYGRLVANCAVTTFGDDARWLYEVPLSTRSDQASVVLRGTIDCLVQHGQDRISVLEFKTGSRRPEHASQLAIYLDAARALFPLASVDGRLIYPD